MGDNRRGSIMWMWAAAGLCAILCAGGILALDGVIAQWAAKQAKVDWLEQGTQLLDTVTMKDVSDFLLGPVLLLAGGVLLVLSSTRGLGWTLAYIGLVQSASIVVADFVKPVFGRLRPTEALGNPGGLDIWFAGEDSFPSAQGAFYAGLFFPLMLVLPRWTPVWLIVPLFVSAQRVMSNTNYMSDVATSFGVAAVMAAAFAFILQRADAHA